MRIALIDNDTAFIRSLKLLLENQRHTVFTFNNPLNALVVLNIKKTLDFLIVDYQMPQMNGCEFLSRLNESLSINYNKILISAYTDILNAEEIKQAGIHYFLAKPIDFKRLMNIIQNHVNGSDKSAV